MTGGTIRVLIVDDHALVVEGLRAILSARQGFEVVGALTCADSVLEETRRLKPNLVLLDIEMQGRDAFDAARQLHAGLPEVRVAFLSAYVKDHFIRAAADAGASGYFSKYDDPATLVDGLRRVTAVGNGSGHPVPMPMVMGPTVAARCRSTSDGLQANGPSLPASAVEMLTPREMEVLRLMGRGYSRTEVAKVLCRSAKTVDGHRERIMAKLNIHSSPLLVRFAIKEGLVAE